MRILIIDECARDRRLIRAALGEVLPGVLFVEVPGQLEMTDALARGGFDVALMEYHLGWTDGLALLRLFKRHYPTVPVIFVTDERSEHLAVQAAKAGLSDYVLKKDLARRLPEAVLNGLAEARNASFAPSRSDEVPEFPKEIESSVAAGRGDDVSFLRAVADHVPCAWYVYDLEEQRHVWANRQFGLIAGSLPTVLDGMGEVEQEARLHPDDVEALVERGRRIAQARDGEIIATEYRVLGGCGEWRWFHSRELVFARTAGGAPRQILGSAQDITEQKAAEQALREARARSETVIAEDVQRYQAAREGAALFQRALDLLPDAVALLDPARQSLVWANRAYWREMGQPRPAAEVPAEEHLSCLSESLDVCNPGGQALPLSAWPLSRALRGEGYRDELVLLRHRITGRAWPMRYTSQPFKHGSGQRALVLLTFRAAARGAALPAPAVEWPDASPALIPVPHFDADVADLSGPKPDLRELAKALAADEAADAAGDSDFVLPRITARDLLEW